MPTFSLVLTANPDFAQQALAELAQAAPEAKTVRLAAGIWGVTAVPFSALATQWQQQPPIFVRHICPVNLTVPLSAELFDLAAVAQTVGHELADWVAPELPFSVQTRLLAEPAGVKPFDVNTAVAEVVQYMSRAPLQPQAPKQILSIVVTGTALLAGVSLAAHNLSDWAGGMRRFAREEGQISRAEFKLLEACETFGLVLPAGGTAIDLGAAPGGWTRVLRQHGMRVTAVDPAELHPSLADDKQMQHQRVRAEVYLKRKPAPVDLLVNDMRLDAIDSVTLMGAFAPYVKPGGQALMSLKLPEKLRPLLVPECLAMLQRRYQLVAARQLFHNRHEITVYLRPK